MKKKFKVVPYLLTILLITLACEIGSLGGPVLIFGGDETPNPMAEYFSGTDAMIPENEFENKAATQEPEDKPIEAQGSANVNAETVNSGSHEYSVEATNFNCGCQVDGNITPIINFESNKVTFGNAENALVYYKISENTYKREYMGYYILQNGSGDQQTQTVVDEENATVVIFNSNGYIMEHYKGASTSPCCYFTNTRIK